MVVISTDVFTSNSRSKLRVNNCGRSVSANPRFKNDTAIANTKYARRNSTFTFTASFIIGKYLLAKIRISTSTKYNKSQGLTIAATEVPKSPKLFVWNNTGNVIKSL